MPTLTKRSKPVASTKKVETPADRRNNANRLAGWPQRSVKE